jgi:hypothetical protein
LQREDRQQLVRMTAIWQALKDEERQVMRQVQAVFCEEDCGGVAGVQDKPALVKPAQNQSVSLGRRRLRRHQKGSSVVPKSPLVQQPEQGPVRVSADHTEPRLRIGARVVGADFSEGAPYMAMQPRSSHHHGEITRRIIAEIILGDVGGGQEKAVKDRSVNRQPRTILLHVIWQDCLPTQ